MRRGTILLVAVVLGTVAPTPPPGAAEVQFYDSDGNLLVDVGADVLTFEDGSRRLFTLAPDGSGTFEVALEPGQKASFRVYGAGREYAPRGARMPFEPAGPLPIVVFAVVEDQCADAVPIGVPSLTAGSTLGATSDPLVAGQFCGTSVSDPAAGQWYSLLGTGTVLRLSTCEGDGQGSADFDTKISVFCLGCAERICVGGNDDSPSCGFPTFHSTLEFCSYAGAEYLVYVHGFGAAQGSFNLEAVDLGAACEPDVFCGLDQPVPPPLGACCSCLAPPFNCMELGEYECLTRTGDPAAFHAEQPCYSPSPAVATYTDAVPGAIPDASLSGLTKALEVADDVWIQDVDVVLDVTHTWVGDLEVTLTHPDGTAAILIDRPGVPDSTYGCSLDDYAGIVLDDTGTGGTIEDLCVARATSPPAYRPAESLSVFEGKSSLGAWVLFVADLASPDPGTLNTWSLSITAGVPFCPDTSGPGGDGDGDGDDEEADDAIELLDSQAVPDEGDGLLEIGFDPRR